MSEWDIDSGAHEEPKLPIGWAMTPAKAVVETLKAINKGATSFQQRNPDGSSTTYPVYQSTPNLRTRLRPGAGKHIVEGLVTGRDVRPNQ